MNVSQVFRRYLKLYFPSGMYEEWYMDVATIATRDLRLNGIRRLIPSENEWLKLHVFFCHGIREKLFLIQDESGQTHLVIGLIKGNRVLHCQKLIQQPYC
ncbi:hypothetical protein GCM10011391_11640 [Pullulanibacillus camelliae]|uniref:Uncharacterized protein n=1 Tax=Pullulanibacillus camelliae TaxID=1707096 RepID=A0A8J2VNU8_9BACL|nr:hypothetical protein [Pullulanibacillus camelliae]GGE34622.1 hypothetical protein GCM10011391_11640 [Pullulanibacillus camelliae]